MATLRTLLDSQQVFVISFFLFAANYYESEDAEYNNL